MMTRRRMSGILMGALSLALRGAVPASAQALRVGQPAPDFAGGGAWINSAPLTLPELRGRAVLVEFWTYG
jgi:hypothetical protein